MSMSMTLSEKESSLYIRLYSDEGFFFVLSMERPWEWCIDPSGLPDVMFDAEGAKVAGELWIKSAELLTLLKGVKNYQEVLGILQKASQNWDTPLWT